MKKSDFRKLTVSIIGLGQMGGSLALAFRKHRFFKRIYGYDTDKNTIKAVLQKKLIDTGTQNLAQAVQQGDLVILAIPVGQILAKLPEAARNLEPEAILCETGSTKEEILNLVERLKVKEFIGLHPVAGTEKEGVKGWDTELFTGKTITLTASSRCCKNAKNSIKTLIRAIGAQPREISAREHDRIFSATSHLPYLISIALVNSIVNNRRKQLSNFLGGAFRDATRVAVSSPEVMGDILFSNRKNIIKSLSRFVNSLEDYRKLLQSGGQESMLPEIIRARKIRRGLKVS